MATVIPLVSDAQLLDEFFYVRKPYRVWLTDSELEELRQLADKMDLSGRDALTTCIRACYHNWILKPQLDKSFTEVSYYEAPF